MCVLFKTSKQCFYVSFIVVSQRAQSEKPTSHFKKRSYETNKFTLPNLRHTVCDFSKWLLPELEWHFQILPIVSQTITNQYSVLVHFLKTFLWQLPADSTLWNRAASIYCLHKRCILQNHNRAFCLNRNIVNTQPHYVYFLLILLWPSLSPRLTKQTKSCFPPSQQCSSTVIIHSFVCARETRRGRWENKQQREWGKK